MKHIFIKIIGTYVITVAGAGWFAHKLFGPYGYKNTEVNHSVYVISLIPFINLWICPPLAIGYGAAQLHDDLLYWFRPTYYQRQIDEYIKFRQLRHNAIWGSHPCSGGFTGNPQITYL